MRAPTMTTDDKSEPRDDGLPAGDIASHEGPLGRWSRLKRQARRKEQGRINKVSPVHAPAQSVAPPAERHPTDADMPPIESLNESSDYSGFLSPRVSEELRHLALRKLFHLPEFNLRDGLDDYDEDFQFFEVLKDTITADIRYQMERSIEQDGDQTQAAESEEPPLKEPALSDERDVATTKHQTSNGEPEVAEGPIGDTDGSHPLSS